MKKKCTSKISVSNGESKSERHHQSEERKKMKIMAWQHISVMASAAKMAKKSKMISNGGNQERKSQWRRKLKMARKKSISENLKEAK